MQPFDLALLGFGIRFKDRDLLLFFALVRIEADQYPIIRFDLALIPIGCFGEFAIVETFLDATYCSSQCLDFVEIIEDIRFNRLGKSFDGVGTTEGIDGPAHSRLVRDDLLRAQGNCGRFFGRDSVRFVIR